MTVRKLRARPLRGELQMIAWLFTAMVPGRIW
jgi:hypothetical protein